MKKEIYENPLCARYASRTMQHIFSPDFKFSTWRKLWIALGTYAPLFDKAVSNIVEVKARGADVVALTTESHRERMEALASYVLPIPDTHPILQPNLGVVPLQLFAYYIALHRGCDIDKPKNLAKSVTVE